MRKTLVLFLLTASLGFLYMAFAQDFSEADKIRGTWLNEEGKAKVYVYRGTDGKYYGRISWLRDPLDDNGKPKLDKENSDPNKKSQPLLNLIILRGFHYKGKGVYKDGTIYDPENGKTYNCNMSLSSDNRLDIRGYIGVSLIGRTSQWTRTD